MLCAATAALALVVSAMLLLRWRVAGEIRSGAVGLAVFLLLGLHPAFQGAVAALHRSVPDLDYADLGMMVAGLGLLLLDQRRAEVNTSRRPLAVFGVGVVIWAFASLLPLVAGLRPDPSVTSRPAGSITLWPALFGAGDLARILFAGALVALGGPMCFRSVRRNLGLEYWVGLSLVAWTAGVATTTLLPDRPLSPAVMAGLRGIGVVVLLAALLSESAAESVLQRSDLFTTRVQALATEAQQRAMREDQRSRAHQARSVVLAVQTAGVALQRGVSALSVEDRATLTSILQDGLAEIDRYVAGGQPSELNFYAGSLVGPLRSSARLLGRELIASIPADLCIQGSRAAVLEAVRIVLAAVTGSTDALELKVRASTRPNGICLSVGSADSSAAWPDGHTEIGSASLPLELVAAQELLRPYGGRIEGRAARSGHRYVIWLTPAADSATA